MSRKVFRVIIQGVGIDLMGAFAQATNTDWAALIGATGRNPFTVAQGMKQFDKLGATDEDDGLAALAGPAGTQLTETIGDLIFLGRRQEHEREPELDKFGSPVVGEDGKWIRTDRPITPETSFATTPFFEAFGLLMDLGKEVAAEQAAEEAAVDPTKAQTATDLGAVRDAPAA